MSAHGHPHHRRRHADQVLTDNTFALLVGMMLDQQYPMEHAFRGPAKVVDRFGSFDPHAIAAADPEEFAALCSTTRRSTASPARWPRGCRSWPASSSSSTTATPSGSGPRPPTARTSAKRLQALPGFGAQKAQIFVALLAKQLDVRPRAGRRLAGDYALDGYRSVADVVDPASLQKVRDFKKEKKAAAKAAAQPDPRT